MRSSASPGAWRRWPTATAVDVLRLLDRFNGALHLGVTVTAAWLVLGSPWIGMYDRLPEGAGFGNLAHVGAGIAALLLGLAYLAACIGGGRRRELFPWLGGDLTAVGRDLAGIFRGRVPTVEGGGLLPLVEGFLLLALIAAGLTGALWLAVQGSELAAMLREQHIVAARAFVVLLLLHVIGVALHLLDFIRD
jgi:hypothetical protein